MGMSNLKLCMSEQPQVHIRKRLATIPVSESLPQTNPLPERPSFPSLTRSFTTMNSWEPNITNWRYQEHRYVDSKFLIKAKDSTDKLNIRTSNIRG